LLQFFAQNFEMAPIGMGKLIFEKNLKLQISRATSFKGTQE
jgi:hypothetical protein